MWLLRFFPDDFTVGLMKSIISEKEKVEKVIKEQEKWTEELEQKLKKQESKSRLPAKSDQKDSQGILVDGHTDLLKNLAKCCNPIPGDKIVGYVSRGRGIIIHRCDCESISGLSKSRFVKVDWNMDKVTDSAFVSSIDVLSVSDFMSSDIFINPLESKIRAATNIVHRLTATYRIDGIIIDGYYNENNAENFYIYQQNSDGYDFDSWLCENNEYICNFFSFIC